MKIMQKPIAPSTNVDRNENVINYYTRFRTWSISIAEDAPQYRATPFNVYSKNVHMSLYLQNLNQRLELVKYDAPLDFGSLFVPANSKIVLFSSASHDFFRRVSPSFERESEDQIIQIGDSKTLMKTRDMSRNSRIVTEVESFIRQLSNITIIIP